MLKRIFKFSLRLGALVAIGAIVVKLLEDHRLPTAPPMASEPEPEPEPAAPVAWVEPHGNVCPTSHPIKAKLGSKVFRKPETRGYDNSKPDRCYASEDEAQRDGFREAQR